jgi:hypothetical protein
MGLILKIRRKILRHRANFYFKLIKRYGDIPFCVDKNVLLDWKEKYQHLEIKIHQINMKIYK